MPGAVLFLYRRLFAGAGRLLSALSEFMRAYTRYRARIDIREDDAENAREARSCGEETSAWLFIYRSPNSRARGVHARLPLSDFLNVRVCLRRVVGVCKK